MGKSWCDASAAARAVFHAADAALASSLPGGAKLSELCFHGPAEVLNRTDVSQPALYTAGVACYRALLERNPELTIRAAAGLSLGEYTALHLAGAFSFEDGLHLVALRGRLMQQAAEASRGSMVALIGGDDAQAQAVCDAAAQSEILVPANYNAPGQIVLSGHAAACQRALDAASTLGLRATPLQVAGAFHSPLMAPAADGLAKALAGASFHSPTADVWSNVTARQHSRSDSASIKKLLVDQLVSPVRWSHSCTDLIAQMKSGAAEGSAEPKGSPSFSPSFWEMAPGVVLKGLMRRIDRTCDVKAHDAAT